MEKSRNRIWLTILALFILAVSAFMVFYVNLLNPFMMDDEWYSTLLYSEEPIRNISDIISAQKWHYMNWGGRAVSHTILQLTLLAGDTFANIANTVMVVLTGIIVTGMTETITGLRRTFLERVVSVTLVIGMVIAFNANWLLSMFWQSGAANYLWITVFILLYAWVFIREISFDCVNIREKLWGVEVWMVPLAIITGWSNENMGPAMFLFSCMVIGSMLRAKRYVPFWMYEGTVLTLLGSVACILAPGNTTRYSFVESEQLGTLWSIFMRCYSESTALFSYLYPVIIVALGIYIILRLQNLLPGKEIDFLCITALLSWGGMILSPHYPDRATYGTMLLLIVAIVSMARKCLNSRRSLTKYFYVGGFFIWLRAMYFLGEYVVQVWAKT